MAEKALERALVSGFVCGAPCASLGEEVASRLGEEPEVVVQGVGQASGKDVVRDWLLW